MSECLHYRLIPDPDGFEPSVEVSFRLVPKDREQLAELLGINIDPTGTPLTPSFQGKDCLGNGEHPGIECCCDECDHYLTCFPDM